MLRNKLLFFGAVALAISLSSPFIFYSYFEQRPNELNQRISFGGPFPFAEQEVTLPEANNEYPLEVKFVSPLEKETNLKIIPFLLTFICFFLFIFALYTIISNFINGRQKKEPK